MKLQKTESTLGEAERVKSNADAYAETYSEEIQDSARSAADALKKARWCRRTGGPDVE
ncbi:MAG TPA: hypothetical protein QF694_05950 [Dehalococcoidia bacterium]|jgi:F0F1-type ATP synthase membrane subunit b/b'|nr:hypothetical protein [Dehalococcoidia bacterium]MDP7090452.1 hypothetical protein [Dehalococcoidia bacterium]MDP7262820.1 hypothetical protein [Dehalococcoidia bacterium]MDP7485375.1 hypothetical protein [Dehalococcoidia bacterium]HJP28334.1 hypothetical protein [Dehalococcoidia bacterium]|tara:strand:+ start:3924 stop:4097 length:174 start_codon:yes stop_codon:yes gene_type:complete